MKYKAEIVEKIVMPISVEASSAEDALNQVTKKYWNGEIIVESGEGVDVEFHVVSGEEKQNLLQKLLR